MTVITPGPGAAAEYWRAASFLPAGQICLLANPLLREPLRLEHVTQRLLGRWGTIPGLKPIYAHLNRLIVGLVRTTAGPQPLRGDL